MLQYFLRSSHLVCFCEGFCQNSKIAFFNWSWLVTWWPRHWWTFLLPFPSTSLSLFLDPESSTSSRAPGKKNTWITKKIPRLLSWCAFPTRQPPLHFGDQFIFFGRNTYCKHENSRHCLQVLISQVFYEYFYLAGPASPLHTCLLPWLLLLCFSLRYMCIITKRELLFCSYT